MLTVGVDLASQPAKTAACQIRWTGGAAEVDPPELGVDDARLLELIRQADKLGIDVPLGWPDAFVAAVAAHHGKRAWPGSDSDKLRLRETDRAVHARTRSSPLSVSTNLIAVPALRAAALQARLAAEGEAVDRTGRGRVVEVYPAAALRCWGLFVPGYKKDPEKRRELIDELQRITAWLRLTAEVVAQCEADDNALDALIAALVARAAACGLCEPIPAEALPLAEKEGWIALPKTDSLRQLAEAQVVSV